MNRKDYLIDLLTAPFFSFLLGLFLTPSVHAETQILNLKERALAETKLEGIKQKSATTAQVSSGMLKLKDPRPEVITRSWLYYSGLKAQFFTPQGKVSTDQVGQLDLSRSAKVLMPGLFLGIQSGDILLSSLPQMNFNMGLRSDISLASQATTTTFISGYSISDCRLNTTLISVGPVFTARMTEKIWNTEPRLSILPQIGQLTYTQTSTNEFARFSKQTSFTSLNINLEVPVSKTYTVFTEYARRQLTDETSLISIPTDNIEIGTKAVW